MTDTATSAQGPGNGTDADLLKVTDLCAGYGSSQVLDRVSFAMGVEAAVILGRNGMGKTTLCNSILGLVRPTSGSVVVDGREVAGQGPTKVARAGVGYVPQGRRLFPSLTEDEHFAMLGRRSRNGRRRSNNGASGGTAWTADRVYELFPRLAERKRNGGAELSGGEQQMVAIGRALLLNTPLIIMDEPSEGLAPAIVDTLIDAVHRLVDEGIGVLVVEQNLGAAAEIASRHLVMVSGRIETETTAQELLADTDAQRRYLGVDT